MVKTTPTILEATALGTVVTLFFEPPLGMVIAKMLVTVLLGLEVLLSVILFALVTVVVEEGRVPLTV